MPKTRRLTQIAILISAMSMVTMGLTAQKPVKPQFVAADWAKPYEPFRIVGNLYYVGSYDLAVYLVTTPQGHILINTGVASSVPMIRKNIGKLGFRFSDIRILLATHTHYDHVGGMAEIQRMTGAKMMVNEKDAGVLADGGQSDFLFGGRGSLFEPVRVDRVLHEFDTVRLGGMKIAVLHHPGHTRGACSFLFDVSDEYRSYRVLIANMPTVLDETKLSGMPTYPNVAADYAYTLDELRKLKFDIWLSSHASQFGLHEKHTEGGNYNPMAFMDQQGYDKEIDDLQKNYDKKLRN